MAMVAAGPVGARVAQKVGDALTGDLVVIEGRIYREVKDWVPTGRVTKTGRPIMRSVVRMDPVDVDLHINPITLALGAGATLLAGAFALWWMGLGVRKNTPEQQADLEQRAAVLQFTVDYIIAYLAWRQMPEGNPDELAACINACQSGTPERNLDACVRGCQARWPVRGPAPERPVGFPTQYDLDTMSDAEILAVIKVYERVIADLRRRAKVGLSLETRARFSISGSILP